MIESPILHASILFFVIALVCCSSRIAIFKKLFLLTPPLLWIFVLPCCLASVDVLPIRSSFYDICSGVILPAALLIYLLSSDIRIVANMGRDGIVAVTSGAITMLIAGPICFVLLKGSLGADLWKQIAPLVAGWTGGYVGMLSVKESVGCGDEEIAPLLVAGSFIAYSWMAVLVLLARFQTTFDRWTGAADRRKMTIETTSEKSPEIEFDTTSLAIWIAVAVGGSQICFLLGSLVPEFPPVFTETTWGYLILLLTGGIVGVIKQARRLFTAAVPFASWGLLIVVASFGAKCTIQNATQFPAIFGMAALLLVFHVIIMIVIAKQFRLSALSISVASQANIGGVVTAPIVANAYEPGSESIGIMMGIFASFLGIPTGLLSAQIMQWLN